MQLTHELKNDLKADLKVAKKIRLHWRSGLCVFLGTLLAAWLLNHFGRLDLARPALIATGAIVFAMAVKWNLRSHVWFWITMAIIVTLHVVLILSVPWATSWVPPVVSAGFCTVDLFIMLAFTDAIEILIARRERRTNSSPLT